MLGRDAGRFVGSDVGRLRAAGVAEADTLRGTGATSKRRVMDVMDLDDFDRQRLQTHRERQEATRHEAAHHQTDALEDESHVLHAASQVRSQQAARTVQAAYLAHMARQTVRWRFWHQGACAVQRAVRIHWARCTVKWLRVKDMRQRGITKPDAQLVASAISPQAASVRPPVSTNGRTSTDMALQSREILE